MKRIHTKTPGQPSGRNSKSATANAIDTPLIWHDADTDPTAEAVDTPDTSEFGRSELLTEMNRLLDELKNMSFIPRDRAQSREALQQLRRLARAAQSPLDMEI